MNDTEIVIEEILEDWAWRVYGGKPNINNPTHYLHLIESLNDLGYEHLLEDMGRPNIHGHGDVWNHNGEEGDFGAEYNGQIEYFWDRERAEAFAKTGVGYGEKKPEIDDKLKKIEPKASPTKKLKSDPFKGRKSSDPETGTLDSLRTPGGGHMLGVDHGQDVDNEFNTIINTYPKNTKIMFVGEGGMSKDDKGSIEFYGEQREFRDKIVNHFPNAEESSWDENANVFDNESLVYDYIEKNGRLTKAQSTAAIWSNMVGQDREEAGMDAVDYLGDEGKKWLNDEASKVGIKFDDPTFENPTSDDYDKLYELNFNDKGNPEFENTGIYQAQAHYNHFRQLELDRKIKEAENQGYTVISTVGNSHVDMYRQRHQKQQPEIKSTLPERTNIAIESDVSDEYIRNVFRDSSVNTNDLIKSTGIESIDGVEGSISITKSKDGGIIVESSGNNSNNSWYKGYLSDDGSGKIYFKKKILRDEETGKLQIIGQGIRIENMPRGTGTKLYYNRIANSKKLGVDEILTTPSGNKEDIEKYNGYYTWPKIGLEAISHREFKNTINKAINKWEAYKSFSYFNNIPQSVQNANYFRDIMKDSRGSEWWEENGSGGFEGKFDLHDEKQMAYVREYAKNVHGIKTEGRETDILELDEPFINEYLLKEADDEGLPPSDQQTFDQRKKQKKKDDLGLSHIAFNNYEDDRGNPWHWDDDRKDFIQGDEDDKRGVGDDEEEAGEGGREELPSDRSDVIGGPSHNVFGVEYGNEKFVYAKEVEPEVEPEYTLDDMANSGIVEPNNVCKITDYKAMGGLQNMIRPNSPPVVWKMAARYDESLKYYYNILFEESYFRNINSRQRNKLSEWYDKEDWVNFTGGGDRRYRGDRSVPINFKQKWLDVCLEGRVYDDWFAEYSKKPLSSDPRKNVQRIILPAIRRGAESAGSNFEPIIQNVLSGTPVKFEGIPDYDKPPIKFSDEKIANDADKILKKLIKKKDKAIKRGDEPNPNYFNPDGTMKTSDVDAYIKSKVPTEMPARKDVDGYYKIVSYIGNKAQAVYIDDETEKEVKIGEEVRLNKILNKFRNDYKDKDEEKFQNFNYLYNRFNDDEYRTGAEAVRDTDKEYEVVISRLGSDIVFKSTGKDWQRAIDEDSGSCMTLSWLGFKYIPSELKYGTMVAYLIDAGGIKDMEKAHARISIKPYFNVDDSSKVQMVANRSIYGADIDGMLETTVDAFLNKHQAKGSPGGKFTLGGHHSEHLDDNVHGCYADDLGESITALAMPLDKKENVMQNLKQLYGWEYANDVFTFNDDGSVDVNKGAGEFEFSSDNIAASIPFKANNITARGGVTYNRLEVTEIDLPNIVDGSVTIENNMSLAFFSGEGSNSVSRDLTIRDNPKLRALFGSFERVGTQLYIHNNPKLNELYGGPKVVGDIIIDGNDNLNDMLGFPRVVRDDIDIVENLNLMNLRNMNLKDDIANGNFTLTNGNFDNLGGGPKIVKKNFKFYQNRYSAKARRIWGRQNFFQGQDERYDKNEMTEILEEQYRFYKYTVEEYGAEEAIERIKKNELYGEGGNKTFLHGIFGGPQYVEGEVLIQSNPFLVTMGGFPKEVEGHITISNNKRLFTLHDMCEYAPSGVTIQGSNDNLRGISGISRRIDGVFTISSSNLDSLADGPAVVETMEIQLPKYEASDNETLDQMLFSGNIMAPWSASPADLAAYPDGPGHPEGWHNVASNRREFLESYNPDNGFMTISDLEYIMRDHGLENLNKIKNIMSNSPSLKWKFDDERFADDNDGKFGTSINRQLKFALGPQKIIDRVMAHHRKYAQGFKMFDTYMNDLFKNFNSQISAGMDISTGITEDIKGRIYKLSDKSLYEDNWAKLKSNGSIFNRATPMRRSEMLKDLFKIRRQHQRRKIAFKSSMNLMEKYFSIAEKHLKEKVLSIQESTSTPILIEGIPIAEGFEKFKDDTINKFRNSQMMYENAEKEFISFALASGVDVNDIQVFNHFIAKLPTTHHNYAE